MDFFRPKKICQTNLNSNGEMIKEDFKSDCMEAYALRHSTKNGEKIGLSLLRAIHWVDGNAGTFTEKDKERVRKALGIVLNSRYRSIFIRMTPVERPIFGYGA